MPLVPNIPGVSPASYLEILAAETKFWVERELAGMYETVLVPTDGSEKSAVAVEHAIGVAKRNDATLHTIHVTELGHNSDALDEAEFGDTIERVQKAGKDAVSEVAARANRDGVDVESTVTEGTATQAILNYVESHDIDIVVMGTEGRSEAAREVIGSVTETVIRSTPVPVLTVNIDPLTDEE
jgi:nucleotide-binding universal stress UspA family protein